MLKELSEDLNSIKKTQSKTTDTVIEKRTIYRETTEELIKPRIKSMICNIRKQKTTMQTTRRKRIQKNEDTISSLWDNFKRSNMCIIVLSEGKEEEEETGSLSEKIVKENFPNLVKEIDMQMQEAQRLPNKMNPETHTKTHHN